MFFKTFQNGKKKNFGDRQIYQIADALIMNWFVLLLQYLTSTSIPLSVDKESIIDPHNKLAMCSLKVPKDFGTKLNLIRFAGSYSDLADSGSGSGSDSIFKCKRRNLCSC